MSCTVAMSNSPVFSPSRVLFPASSPSPSPMPPLAPPSPLFLRLQKPLPGSSSGRAASPPPAIFKRKRPAMLSIPAAEMTFVPVAPETPAGAARGLAEEEREDCGYWVCCKRGRRDVMEDRYSALVGIQGDPKQALFGIFDGHGGPMAAEFAARNLDKNIIHEVSGGDAAEIEVLVKRAYLKTDSDFLKEQVRGGSCCVTAFIRGGELIISNAGDCRAVICRDGSAEALTQDHRPSREDERVRIEAQGGYVELCHGVWRIQGSLAVSRGIGDSYLKKWVIAEPGTKRLRMEADHEFLILASDGLWDKVPNQEAVDVARSFLMGGGKSEPMLACRKLMELSLYRGSADDISVMLVDLRRYI